ncbi:MAG: ABC transporter permease [Ruminococcus sp.]|nr:ABC transporter permease [Ruminococcus sp.]
MKLKRPLLYAVIAGANALSLAAALVLTLAGGSIARSQGYNSAAQRWDPHGESTQISCFFSDDAGYTTDGMNALRAALKNELSAIVTDPSGNIPKIPDAYSTPIGTGYVTSDSTGKGEAALTAVGGDFFLFRDFKLLSGAYFSDDDIMQDGAVIERSLAWTLYGSANVAGQLMYIDGVQYYISGVIDDPTDKYQKRTADETPRVYISYKGAESLPQVRYSAGGGYYGEGMGSGTDTANKLTKITCYECITYDPVENFGINTVKKQLEGMYDGKLTIVNNTERFSPSVMRKAYRRRADLAVRKDTVVYPYWENASRIAEFKLSPIYFWRTVCFVLPTITAIWLIWLALRFAKKRGRSLISALIERYRKAVYSRRQKKANINTD